MIKTLSALAMGLLLATSALAAPQKGCCDAPKGAKKAACCPGPCCPPVKAKVAKRDPAAQAKPNAKAGCCTGGKCCTGGACCR